MYTRRDRVERPLAWADKFKRLLTPTRRWVSDERLHAILDRVVAYPAGDHWSGDTEDRKALRLAETAARETLSPVKRLEIILHPCVGFVIMPLFAFANAGMPIAFVDLGNPVTGAVVVGFALGKPVGVLTPSVGWPWRVLRCWFGRLGVACGLDRLEVDATASG